MASSLISPESTRAEARAAGRLVQPERVISVDILRGLVMVIMALDHTRDFLTFTRSAPEGVAHTTAALFFTRFITHYCAPVFAFLAGTGAFLSTRRGKSIQEVSRFFLTRGLWLLLLEFTIIDFAWGFVPWVQGGVIWGLGWSMIAMALIVRLPVPWIAAFGLGLIATHNLLDRISPSSFGKLSWLWTFLHTPGPIQITAHHFFSIRYVLIPWVGVMAAGFAFGAVLLRPDRRKWILTVGIAATALFFCLRGLNLYGNGVAGLPFGYPRSAGPWSVQTEHWRTVISFFNALKYPPSLDYVLMTLGPSLILLGLFDRAKAERGMSRVLAVFGRVPMFYYILHLYIIHFIAIGAALVFHQPVWIGSVIADHPQRPIGYGHGLPFIYVAWLIVVLLLYPLCRWFMDFRTRHRDWRWLRYF